MPCTRHACFLDLVLQEPAPAGATAPNTAAPSNGSNASTPALRRRLKGKAAARSAQAAPRNGRERTRQERYTEVEAYWRSLKPEQRQELLRVPLAALLQGGNDCRPSAGAKRDRLFLGGG